MKYCSLLIIVLLISCSPKPKKREPYTEVQMEIIYEDSLSIRAIELLSGSLAFAANKGVLGTIDLQDGTVRTGVQKMDSILPEFRAVAHTGTDFFMLSVASPALLYKTGEQGEMELVYREEGPEVFYDAMKFWNNQEGIAIGDSMGGCISIILTRDGGNTWQKVNCTMLPKSLEDEGAFAASNTNIAIAGDTAWVATSKARILKTVDKGRSWILSETPIRNDLPTEGIYSIDFYNNEIGIAVGGDYTKPNDNTKNKALTRDGGASWQLLANEREPEYKSCVQFVPGSGGKEIVALGFTGISYSSDMGENWQSLSDESFYTLRFLNDSIAYAAGKGRIAKLHFK